MWNKEKASQLRSSDLPEKARREVYTRFFGRENESVKPVADVEGGVFRCQLLLQFSIISKEYQACIRLSIPPPRGGGIKSKGLGIGKKIKS